MTVLVTGVTFLISAPTDTSRSDISKPCSGIWSCVPSVNAISVFLKLKLDSSLSSTPFAFWIGVLSKKVDFHLLAGPLIGPRDIKPIARNRCEERRLSGASCGVRAEPWLLPPISTSLKENRL